MNNTPTEIAEQALESYLANDLDGAKTLALIAIAMHLTQADKSPANAPLPEPAKKVEG